MKIGSSIDPALVNDASLRNARTSTTAPVSIGTVTASKKTDQVEFSAAGAELGGVSSTDFDSAKVDAIRAAIRNGSFTINADKIAGRLIDDAAALLRPRNT